MNRVITFWRCAYRFPRWKPGLCKHRDGFARTHWMESREAAASMKAATERQGGEAFIEETT